MRNVSRALSIALALASTAFPQTSQLSGLIQDPQKAAVIGAEVSIKNQETGVKLSGTSNRQGIYTFAYLQPGVYEVTVQSPGFQTVTRRDVTLEVAQVGRMDFDLVLGSTNQAVTVSSEAIVLRTEDTSVATVVNRDFAENLPLNGRSFHTLFELTPGVVLTKASFGSSGQFAVNGQRADTNYFSVDGVSANIGVSITNNPGQSMAGAMMGQTSGGGTSNLVSVDALQEFRIQTSTFAPEYGRGVGAQISVVTRSGTNQYHGTLFDYFRNDKLDANDFFNNALRLDRPAERQNDYGGVIGGPILKDRTFFFGSYEGLQLRQPVTQIVDVPSMTARQGASPQMRPFFNLFPIPNGADNLTAAGVPNGFAKFSASYSNPADLSAKSLRVDHRLKNNMMLFSRYNHAPTKTVVRGLNTNLDVLATNLINTETFTAGMTWVVSPSVSNDLRFNRSRSNGAGLFSADNFGGGAAPDLNSIFPGYNNETGYYILTLSGGTNANWSTLR